MIRKSSLNDPPAKRAKKPRPSHRKDDPHAKHASWRYREDENGVAEFIGHFDKPEDSKDERERHAFGTSRHFQKAGITKIERKPDMENGYYVIRLTRDRDNLHTFEEWATPHHLLDDLHHARLMKEKEQDDQYRLAFSPLADGHAKSMVGKLNWELMDAPANTIRLVTEDPAVAFQTAFYLHKHDYIKYRTQVGNAEKEDNRNFWRINQEVKNPHNEEFIISINPDQNERFQKEFPNAIKPESQLDTQWQERINKSSALKTKPDAVEASHKGWQKKRPKGGHRPNPPSANHGKPR